MNDDFASRELPNKRTGRHLKLLARWSWWQIAGLGLGLYIAIVLITTLIEALSAWSGHPIVVRNDGCPGDFLDLLYFNFITVLTIGYGDIVPVHAGRVISICESLSGAGLFGLMISVVTAKFLASPPNTVVFSRFGYYCTDDERFLIIFVNTTQNLLVNVDISSCFKLGGDWPVVQPIRTPLIKGSVWTFHIDKMPISALVAKLKDGDVLRCSLMGQVGAASFSAAIEYYANEIVVISNRNELTAFKGFVNADLASAEMRLMFHYRPQGAQTLDSFVSARRVVTQ